MEADLPASERENPVAQPEATQHPEDLKGKHQGVKHRPFYAKLQFWNSIIAVSAVILSQLPPIATILNPGKLKIAVRGEVELFQTISGTHLDIPVSLLNAGSGVLTVSKIEVGIVDERGYQWVLPAQTYFSRTPPNAPGQPWPEYPIPLIVLKPAQGWPAMVHCYGLLTTDEERRMNEITSEIRDSINKRQKPNGRNMVEADPQYVSAAKQFFAERFSLHPGEYSLLIAGESDSGKTLSVEGFTFGLSQDQIHSLQSTTDRYEYGDGIYWYSGQLPAVYVQVRGMETRQAERAYQHLSLAE